MSNNFTQLASFLSLLRKVKAAPNKFPDTAYILAVEHLQSVSNETVIKGDLSFEPDYINTEYLLSAIYSNLDAAEATAISSPNMDDEDINLVKSYLLRVREFLAISQTGAQWGHIKANYLTSDLVDGLKMAGVIMKGSGIKWDLSNADISKALAELENLTQTIKSSNLPDQIKGQILSNLLKLTFILRNYIVWGPQDLEQQLKATIGDIALSYSSANKKQKDELSKISAWAGQFLVKYEKFGKFVKTTEHLAKLLFSGDAS